MHRATRRTLGTLAAAGALVVAGCDLDLTNPGAPAEEVVLTDTEGVIAHAVAMQGQYATSTNVYARAPSLVTDEWGTRTAALAADRSLVEGNPDPGFGVVSGPYNVTYRIARSANNLLAATSGDDIVPGEGMRLGIASLANLYKAMALGMAIQQYESIPVDQSLDPIGLSPRAEVLDTVLTLLDRAREAFDAAPDLSGFNTRILASGFDVGNTIDAMTARYHLMAGNHAAAIEAADRVNLGSLSVFPYPDPDVNPIYNYHYQLNYTAARAAFAEEAEEGDERAAYWVNVGQEPFIGQIGDLPLVDITEYDARNDPYHVYLPGEMLLIRAEAYARTGDLEQARHYVNEVRTKCDTGLNQPEACLDPLEEEDLATQEDILRQIAHERRYELYMQGLRWEDMRRFADVIDETPSLMWLSIPQRECEANPLVQC